MVDLDRNVAMTSRGIILRLASDKQVPLQVDAARLCAAGCFPSLQTNRDIGCIFVGVFLLSITRLGAATWVLPVNVKLHCVVS